MQQKNQMHKFLAGGHRLTENGLDKGFFFEPTLIAVPDNHHKLAQEEIFGPVLTVIKSEGRSRSN